MATLQATPAEARAGDEVVVSGIRFIGYGPVTIRLHTLDGPVLATSEVGPTSNSIFKVTATIPPGTPPGPAVLIATQQPDPGSPVPWGVPARTVVNVIGPDGAVPAATPPESVARPAGLVRDQMGAGAFVLVGLGVAAASLLAASVLALVASRKSSTAVSPAPGEIR